MTNQVECTRIPEGKAPFSSNGGDAHTFGLEPHFGCCTVNFNQGWPKFALSSVMRTEDGLAVTAIAPVSVETAVGGKKVRLTVDTQYPFRDTVRIKVAPEEAFAFAVSVRIPGFAREAGVRIGEERCLAEPGSFFTRKKLWEKEEEIEITFRFEPQFVKRPSGMAALRRGPLFYALPIDAKYEKIEYERDGVIRKFPYCDYAITPESQWGFGFGEGEAKAVYGHFGEIPFDRKKPPVMLEMEMVPIAWKKENGICAELPESLKPVGEPAVKRLYPYGCTTLRMTEMPKIGGLRGE